MATGLTPHGAGSDPAVHDTEETSMTPDAHEGRDRVLQFGTGRFLRGFVDAFLDEENLAKAPAGGAGRRSVTVVETSGSGSARRLAAQGCRYRLLVRGRDQGRVVDECRVIDVIDRSIDANHEPARPGGGRARSRGRHRGLEHHRGRLPLRALSCSPVDAARGTRTSGAAGRHDPALRAHRGQRAPACATSSTPMPVDDTCTGRWSTRCSTRMCGP